MKKRKIDNPVWDKEEQWWYNVWKKVEPPFCPSKGEIKFYEKAIKKILGRKNPRVLVLGATPEIRDLLAKYKNLNVYVININVPVYQAMTRLMKKKNPKEKLVVADWLKMPFKKNTFDLSLSHGAFSVINLKNHQKLYQNIKRVLKKDGYAAMSRVNVEPLFKKSIDFKQFFDKYRKDPDYFRSFQNRVYLFYRLVGVPGVYNRKSHAFKYHILARKITDQARKLGFSEKQIKTLYCTPDFSPKLKCDDTEIRTLKKLKSMIREHFVIRETYQDDYHPIAEMFIDFLCFPKK